MCYNVVFFDCTALQSSNILYPASLRQLLTDLEGLAGYLADVVVVQLERDQPLEVVKHAVVHDPTYYNQN
jgi:hypothetical protein